jgi:hypothetical protein
MQVSQPGIQKAVYQQIYPENQNCITDYNIENPIPEYRRGRAQTEKPAYPHAKIFEIGEIGNQGVRSEDAFHRSAPVEPCQQVDRVNDKPGHHQHPHPFVNQQRSVITSENRIDFFPQTVACSRRLNPVAVWSRFHLNKAIMLQIGRESVLKPVLRKDTAEKIADELNKPIPYLTSKKRVDPCKRSFFWDW